MLSARCIIASHARALAKDSMRLAHHTRVKGPVSLPQGPRVACAADKSQGGRQKTRAPAGEEGGRGEAGTCMQVAPSG